jgi:hypothetical protein
MNRHILLAGTARLCGAGFSQAANEEGAPSPAAMC